MESESAEQPARFDEDSYRSPMQLCAKDCDTPEDALRKLVLPFFERPNARWLHSVPSKVGRRSAWSCVAWPGALPATLKAHAYWPTDGGAPRVEVLRWSGDTLTAAHAWRELEAQAYGRPPSLVPPFGLDLPSIPPLSDLC
jgi:hypothetical protein